MLQISIIVFREILEIALVISILFVATKGVKGRDKWILSGIGLGLSGALLVALFTDNISESFEGSGQEIFNALILLISSAMVSWTVVWMKKFGKKISANLKQLGKSVLEGTQSMVVLMTVVAFAVLREGAEVVLFGYGSFVSGGSFAELALGATIGLICGIIVGLALYFGLLKVLGRHFFSITSWMLVFLAAGMVASATSFLSRAGIVPEIIYPVWDSAFLVSEEGLLGKILHALFGYISKPSAAQLIAYLATILLISFGLNFDFIRSKFKQVVKT